MYRGDIRLGDTIDLKFTTRSFSTGAPTQLAGTPVISAYPNNSTTQITAGITLTVDFDAVTGLNNVRVVATSGNGYATASNYDLVITTGTVGGVSVVGECIGSFSIEARSALMPTTAARTLDVSAGGEAGLDWANIGSPTTANNLSGTNIDTDQVVASVTGAVGSVTGAVGSVTGAVGSVTGNVGGNVTGSVGSVTGLTNATIADAVWDEAQADHVAAGSFGVTASEIADILVDTAEIGAAGAGLTNINLPDQTMNITGNITGNLSGSVGSVTGNVGGSVASVTAGVTLANDAITSAAIAASGAGEIADAVWDEATAGHATAGTYGLAVSDILTDTAVIGAAGAGLSAIPWNAAWDAEVQSEVNDGLVAYGASTATDVTNAAANVSVDEIQVTALADLFNTNSGTTYASAVAGSVVKEIADNAGGSALTEAGIADAVWDELRSGHVAAGSFGEGIASVQGSITGSVASVTGAVGSVTGNVGGNVTGSVGSVATGGIAAATFAANAINAAALAADAVTEIQSGLSTLDAAGVRTAVGLASANLDTQLAALPTADENADALLGRNVSGGSSTGRTVKQALHVLRNKTEIAGGTLTVYDTDDTTASFTAAVTTTAGDPVSAIDPA